MRRPSAPVLIPIALLLAPSCAPPDGPGDATSGGSDASEIRRPHAGERPWRPDPDRPRPYRPPPGEEREEGEESPPEDSGGAPAEEAAASVPYGYWGLNGFVTEDGLAEVSDRLVAGTFQVANENPTWTVGTLLPMVRDTGMTVSLRLSGDHGSYTTSSGSFDLDAWKDRVDLWAGSGVQAFIDDGTLAGHMILDDIHNFSGADPTGDQLDEMARYSKEVLPGLMTFVRCQASTMPEPTAGVYVHLDASVNQYQSVDGEIEEYVAEELAAATALDLGIINGLNIADGGDGSSGQPGWRSGRYAMSAEEILEYGSLLAEMPGVGMFLNWEYDGSEEWSDGTIGADYFDQPTLQAALAELGRIVGGTPATRLLREDEG